MQASVSRRRGAALVPCVSIAAALVSADARADGAFTYQEGPHFLLEAFFGAVGGELTTRPTLDNFSTPGTFSYPGIPNGSIGAGSSPVGGLDAHGGLRMNTPIGIDFPLAGLRVVIAANAARLTLQGNGGQTASLALTELVGTIALPGIGAHATFGPVVLTASIHPVLQWGAGSGTVTQGFISADIDASSFDLGLDMDFRLCHAWGHDSPAVCAVAEPLLWRTSSAQGGPYNGVLFGIGMQVW